MRNKLQFTLLAALFIAFGVTTLAFAQKKFKVSSPDAKLEVSIELSSKGEAFYSVKYNQTDIMKESRLGISREDGDFCSSLSVKSVSKPKLVKDDYELFTGKKRFMHYEANEQVYHLLNKNKQKMDIIFRVSDHGVAFRYSFPEKSKTLRKISEEATSFHFLPDTKSWLQPLSPVKSGWCETNPSYEEYYEKGIKAGTPSPLGVGWIYPALFNTGETWMLISETSLGRNYCGSRLVVGKNENEYKVGFPDPREGYPGGAVMPESTTPWATPWRIIAVGSLADIAESTLGTDLAEPAKKMDVSFVKPGIASWSWALLKDNSVVYDVQKKFIDYAADMKWQYCLVDVNWDTQIGYDKIAELAAYAQQKGVGLILWYNSSGDWNSTKYHPKSMLLTHEAREKEFSRISQMGIKGIKVDFFGGDGQSMIAYYHDIFDDAAKYKLLVNCHGATLPRGWQRTYPHLVTMESIKGFEFITFEQVNANEEPAHCTIIPFTRNVFDPMDFTPMCLYKIPNINRLTTSAFELALPTLFTSGVQHMAETPDGMLHVPGYVKEYLQSLPTQWESSKLIDGYPGKLAIMARESQRGWYISGINGEKTIKHVTLDLSFIGAHKGYMITDGNEPLSFAKKEVDLSTNKTLNVSMKEYGGFVIFIEK